MSCYSLEWDDALSVGLLAKEGIAVKEEKNFNH